MLAFFRAKRLLSEEDELFQIETYKWLLKYFGGDDFYVDTKLVLPTRDHFPDEFDSADNAAVKTFLAVKRFAGMEEWPCQLVRQEPDSPVSVAPTLIVQNSPRSPLGTFSAEEKEKITITYNPEIVCNPVQLVSTFAHELAHYLTGTCQEPPPGGWENWEFATDIAATFLGFGIFMSNSSFSFRQYASGDSVGWSSSRSGYLSETEHVYALALFMLLKDIPFSKPEPYLKTSLRKTLAKALKQIANDNALQYLKSVGYQVGANGETGA